MDLERKLAEMIKDTCNLIDPVPEDLSYDTPLIGPESELGLDSLDAVEIVVMIQKQFGIRLDSEKTSRQVLQSLKVLADFIRENQKN